METRLNLLCEAGVIDKDICKGRILNTAGKFASQGVNSPSWQWRSFRYGDFNSHNSPLLNILVIYTGKIT